MHDNADGEREKVGKFCLFKYVLLCPSLSTKTQLEIENFNKASNATK